MRSTCLLLDPVNEFDLGGTCHPRGTHGPVRCLTWRWADAGTLPSRGWGYLYFQLNVGTHLKLQFRDHTGLPGSITAWGTGWYERTRAIGPGGSYTFYFQARAFQRSWFIGASWAAHPYTQRYYGWIIGNFSVKIWYQYWYYYSH